ncbi:hypothetical protein MJ579_11605 [Klebsiella pneumoniae]|nr:hypothetical protein MJ579_11605 [Klebsiella pneumoniae]
MKLGILSWWRSLSMPSSFSAGFFVGGYAAGWGIMKKAPLSLVVAIVAVAAPSLAGGDQCRGDIAELSYPITALY